MRVHVCRNVLSVLFVLVVSLTPARAADEASIRGAVLDPLGGPIVGAKVEALRDGAVVRDVLTDGEGKFVIDGMTDGRYILAASASGFERRETVGVSLRGSARTVVVLTLEIGTLHQDVVVTATASEVSAAQIGASVTVVDAALIESLGSIEVFETLRGMPGVVVVQNGQRGGVAGLFVRGGSSNFNKVLIDGVPANEIGGAFDFANVATTGVARVEVLRGSNSVAYGSDAMTGVVDISTRRGTTRRPEAVVSADVGSLSTSHADLSMGGTARELNYFASYANLRSDNDLPNNTYRNDTIASRVGVRLGRNTDVSGTVRWFDSDAGSPNAFSYYQIADDSTTSATATYGAIAARTQWTDRWQSTIRFGISSQDNDYANPTPTGTPSDASAFANYLGKTVTITGGNGYSVTGQAILDYCCTFPSLYSTSTTRRLLVGQTNYQVTSTLNVAGGVRAEHDHGVSDAGFPTETTRNNYGGFMEGRGAVGSRVFVTAGVGFDHNTVFGYATTPKVSVAGYLRPPSSSPWGDTKLTFNAGRGIKQPSLDQELSSVFALASGVTAPPAGVEPVGPERSRTIDIGVEQGLARGRARVRVAYFHNEFSDLIEYISKSVLPQLGVPADVTGALSFGAYANAQSNRSKGVETSADAVAGAFTLAATYTHLDAVVTQSLSDAALFPVINPAFPGIEIGQYSPLVGARPFRRPANSGSLMATYRWARAHVSVAGYFFGRADDSTYLSDAFFGASMLLPNKDLAPAYQRFDINGSYRIHPRLRWYVTAENAFDKKYEAAAGYPSLPRVVRTGVTVALGGDARTP